MHWLPYSSHTSHHPSQTPCLSWTSYATQKLMFDSGKMLWYFSKFLNLEIILQKRMECLRLLLGQNFIAYRSSKVSDCIFEIHALWQSGFSRVYSNSCCSCSFEPEILRIGQSSHKMYCNNILNIQVSTTILNAHAKKSGYLSYAHGNIGWLSQVSTYTNQ